MGRRPRRPAADAMSSDSEQNGFNESAFLAARGIPPLDLPERGPRDFDSEEEPEAVTKIAAVNGEPKRTRAMHARDLGVQIGRNGKAHLAVAIPEKRPKKKAEKPPPKSLSFVCAIPDYEGSKEVLNVEFRLYPICVCHLIDPHPLTGWVTKDTMWGGIYDHRAFIPGTGQAAIHRALEERLNKPISVCGMFVDKRVAGPSQHTPYGKAGVRPVVIPADALPGVWIPLLKKCVYMPPDARVHGLQVEEYRRAARNDLYYMAKANMDRRLTGRMGTLTMLDMTMAWELPHGLIGKHSDGATDDDQYHVSSVQAKETQRQSAKRKEKDVGTDEAAGERDVISHDSRDMDVRRRKERELQVARAQKRQKAKEVVDVSDSEDEDSVFVNSPPRAFAKMRRVNKEVARINVSDALDDAAFLELLKKHRKALFQGEGEDELGLSSSALGGRPPNVPPRPSAPATVPSTFVSAASELGTNVTTGTPAASAPSSRGSLGGDMVRGIVPPRVEQVTTDSPYKSVVADYYSLSSRPPVPVASVVATADWGVGDLPTMATMEDTTPVVLAIAAAAQQEVLAVRASSHAQPAGTGNIHPAGVRRCSIDLNRRMS